MFKPKAPKPSIPNDRIVRAASGGRTVDAELRDRVMGPTIVTDKKGGQKPGQHQQLKGRQFGIKDK